MPKRKWKSVVIERKGEMLTAHLHPPGTVGNSRYWSFSCRGAGIQRKSLKVTTFADARQAALNWFSKEDVRRDLPAPSLSWPEWEQIQRAHFAKKRDQKRAGRTLDACLDSKKTFVSITNAADPSAVTPDTVEQFQQIAVKTEWTEGRVYTSSTIGRCLGHMSASFNRCRITAGKKCQRGIVAPEKLLTVNPFEQVSWLESGPVEIRHLSHAELRAFLGWRMFGSSPLISAVLKISVWGCGRIEEITELRWDWISDDGIVCVPDDMAKWGKGRQFRIPMPLLHAIKSFESKSPFVWDGTVPELRKYHIQRGGKGSANQLAEFTPTRLRGRLQKWIQSWAEESNLVNVSHHTLRKTALQWSREEQIRKAENFFAELSNVGLDVATKHYTNDPARLRAEILYQNISRELMKDSELAVAMGLEIESKVPSLDDVQSALAEGRVDDAKRLLESLQARQSA